jgi:3-isopropylmalate dehydrogenase
MRIVTLPGDGIGPEVLAAALQVLEHVAPDLTYEEQPIGGAAIDAHGTPLPDASLTACRQADAVLLGAVGGPKWSDPSAAVRPEQALFALRGGLGLFANLRPVKVHPALVASSPLRPELLEGVDMLIVRELTGGVYFGERQEAAEDTGDRRAVDTMPYSEDEVRRIVLLAGAYALLRKRRLTSVDKANVLATSRLWRRVVDEERRRMPDVEVSHQLVDSCAMLLIKRPADFDVIVTENLFGDILSDEAAVLAGSLGLLPSASLADRLTKHGTFGLYEPIHGSAPDIAGQDKANPIGTILSAAMMMFSSFKRPDVSQAIEDAVSQALEGGWRTADLADPANPDDGLVVVGTTGMTRAVIEALEAAVPA